MHELDKYCCCTSANPDDDDDDEIDLRLAGGLDGARPWDLP
jgi:hypothetical protein